MDDDVWSSCWLQNEIQFHIGAAEDEGEEGSSGYFNYDNVDEEYDDVRAQAEAEAVEADDDDYESYLESQRFSEESVQLSSSSLSYNNDNNDAQPDSSRTTSYRDFVWSY